MISFVHEQAFFASPNHAQRLGTKPNHISHHARVHDTLASIPRVCLSTDRRTEIRGWLIHIARHKSRWHLGCLRRFLRPGASDAKCPSGPSESEKARVRVFLLGAFLLGVYVQSLWWYTPCRLDKADSEATQQGLLQGVGTIRRSNP